MAAGWAWEEMAGARLWDGRCRRSLVRISERLGQQPGVSLSAGSPVQDGGKGQKASALVGVLRRGRETSKLAGREVRP